MEPHYMQRTKPLDSFGICKAEPTKDIPMTQGVSSRDNPFKIMSDKQGVYFQKYMSAQFW